MERILFQQTFKLHNNRNSSWNTNLGNNGSKEEALDYLQRAIKIDQTDVTLYFKFAYFAALSKKFHMARSALEESLYNQQHNSEQPLIAKDNEGKIKLPFEIQQNINN